MGFFKNIFKGKEGGTFVGNLLRKGSNWASGGLLGNGAQLAKRDRERAIAQMEDEERRLQQLLDSNNKKSMKLNGQLGNDLGDSLTASLGGLRGSGLSGGELGSEVGERLGQTVEHYAVNGSGYNPNAGESIIKAYAKKWWWAIALGLGGLITLTILLTRKGSKPKFKFKR